MQARMIGSGVRYTEYVDAKLCSVLLELHFFLPHAEQTAAACALLCDLLTASSKRCPSRAALTQQLDALYAADLTAKLTQCGDALMFSVSAEWLDDAYAPDGTPVTKEMLALVYDCLHAPNSENGAFDAEEFRICMQNLLNDIDCEQNDKRSYAMQKAAETAFRGEPAALPHYGSREAAETVTAEFAYALWQRLLQSAPVEAVCVTPEQKPQIETMVQALFSGRQTVMPLTLPAPSPCKAVPETVSEDAQTVQSKLILVYKYEGVSQDAVRLLCAVLGSAPNSLLFRNVREQLGLCYYCGAQPILLKSALTLDLGTRADQLEAAQQAVIAQVTAVQAGDFPDALLEEAILYLEYGEAVCYDSADGIAGRCLMPALYGDSRTPAARSAAFRALTKQALTDAARCLRLDTVCILRGTLGEGAAS